MAVHQARLWTPRAPSGEMTSRRLRTWTQWPVPHPIVFGSCVAVLRGDEDEVRALAGIGYHRVGLLKA